MTQEILVDRDNVKEVPAAQSAFEARLDYRLSQAGIIDPALLITDEDREHQYDIAVAMTGNTPFTKHENDDGNILVKRLSQNPSECHYDLVYLRTLRKLEQAGVIWPVNREEEHGQRVELVELSSGSAGISFGFASKVMGFRSKLFVPSELEKPRIQVMEGMGLDIEITPPGYVKAASDRQAEYIEGLKEQGYQKVMFDRDGGRSQVLEKGEHRVCIVNHSENQVTLEAFRELGREMADYLPEGLSPDYLLLIIGNFTSSSGISEIMKAKYPDLDIIGLESTENPNWFDQINPGRYEEIFGKPPEFVPTRIYGTSQRGVRLFFARPELFDDIKLFEPEKAIAYQSEYNEGRPSGETIGRSTAAALMIAEALTATDKGSTVMVLNYDKGDRYDSFVSAQSEPIDPTTIQPFGYKQPKPTNMSDVPSSLQQAYA
jgi:cysteine synthase